MQALLDRQSARAGSQVVIHLRRSHHDRLSLLLGIAATTLLQPARRRSAAARVQIGVLNCRGGASVGFVVGSVTNLGCVLQPAGRPDQPYVATIRKVGLDLGITQETALVMGRVRAGRATPASAISPATMPARRAAPRSASASAPTCWSAAPPIPSRCSRSACRARPASMSLPAWRVWSCGRDGESLRSSLSTPSIPASLAQASRARSFAARERGSQLRRSAATFPSCQILQAGRSIAPPTQSWAELQIRRRQWDKT